MVGIKNYITYFYAMPKPCCKQDLRHSFFLYVSFFKKPTYIRTKNVKNDKPKIATFSKKLTEMAKFQCKIY